MSQDFTKSAGFHEIRRISKDQLPGMVRPMFYILSEQIKGMQYSDLMFVA